MYKRHSSPLFHSLRAIGIASGLTLALGGLAGCGERVVSFSDHVQPILDKRCIECHVPGAEGYEASGLELTSYESLMRGTRYGPIIEPGDPFISVLNQLVEGRADPSIAMPHGGHRLPDSELKTLREWVAQGARDN
ncbi:c-type cytochrome domain-containing protein [Thioalkalivibrio paradoxus]|uniref:Signal peptide protein n=1 Tax=Thioalkalivibrio paradoxus ARh 1 TaxID=713585 RepID=W0DMN1_9GAMM|nr:c-type cytochrome domain-containing protein [Thioalkalivibrio paradoxus]AHE98238.1 signal peptide protein [Thioalkalivibrio paradoxus ARh 1]